MKTYQNNLHFIAEIPTAFGEYCYFINVKDEQEGNYLESFSFKEKEIIKAEIIKYLNIPISFKGNQIFKDNLDAGHEIFQHCSSFVDLYFIDNNYLLVINNSLEGQCLRDGETYLKFTTKEELISFIWKDDDCLYFREQMILFLSNYKEIV